MSKVCTPNIPPGEFSVSNMSLNQSNFSFTKSTQEKYSKE